MKLTIKNISRLNELGDSNSAYIVTNPTVHDDSYEIVMQYKEKAWKVVLHRDKPDGQTRWDMVVFLGGIGWEATRMTTAELNSPGLTLSIIENLMNTAIKKIKI